MTTSTKGANVQEYLGSLLCGQVWHWDSRDENQITFRENGTGELICRAELNVWIAAEFDWKALSPTTLDQKVFISDQKQKQLGKLELELTLTKRRIPRLGLADMSHYTINEALLEDAAFRPKSYNVVLQSGAFLTPFDQLQGRGIAHIPMYMFHLGFDKSPYPPRDEWKRPEGAPDALKFWEWKEFCGGQTS